MTLATVQNTKITGTFVLLNMLYTVQTFRLLAEIGVEIPTDSWRSHNIGRYLPHEQYYDFASPFSHNVNSAFCPHGVDK